LARQTDGDEAPGPIQALRDDPDLGSVLGPGRDGRGIHVGSSGIGPGSSLHGTGTSIGMSTLGALSIQGSLDESVIDAVLKRSANTLRYCYQRALNRSSGLSGSTTMRFTIASDGSVSSAAVLPGHSFNDDVETCLAGRLQRLQFPAPSDGGAVIVDMPLTFAPK
jgi:outer membrane biosynthesis protein TonB